MMKTLNVIALTLTIIGAINWGLIGLLDFNLVEAIFGQTSIIPRIVYSLVGLTSLINIGILLIDIPEK